MYKTIRRTRNAFGDDKKFQLTDNVDNKFNIDLKVTTGDGLSTGLEVPIEIDLHEASIVNTIAQAEAGMPLTEPCDAARGLLQDRSP